MEIKEVLASVGLLFLNRERPKLGLLKVYCTIGKSNSICGNFNIWFGLPSINSFVGGDKHN